MTTAQKPDPVAAALAMAKAEAAAAAGNQTDNTGGAVSTQNTGGAVATAQPGTRRSLADIAANAAFAVDGYIGVENLGIKIGNKDNARFDELFVTLKFGEARGGWIIRANVGGGAKYATSYDNAVEAKSRKPWEDVITQFQNMDSNAYVSDLMELPVTLTEPVTLKDKSVVKAGTRLGVSLSYQNYKFFSTWFAEQFQKHGADKVLRVRIGFEPKSNAGGAKYGIFTWTNLDDEQEAVAA